MGIAKALIKGSFSLLDRFTQLAHGLAVRALAVLKLGANGLNLGLISVTHGDNLLKQGLLLGI